MKYKRTVIYFSYSYRVSIIWLCGKDAKKNVCVTLCGVATSTIMIQKLIH